jgi:hypothetical protein
MKALIPITLGALLAAPFAAAHHSFAVHFVADRTVTVTGVVKEFRFTNPHGILLFTVTDENGVEHEWKAETNSPNVLRRRGWNKDSMKPGDKVTIDGFPSRDDDRYMRISHVVLPDGSELFAQARAD